MKRYEVLIAESAEAEIEEAYLYIRQDSSSNAAAWRAGLLHAAESLSAMPTRCQLAPENGPFEFEIRHFIYGSYRLLFTILDDALVILHVRHAARRPMNDTEVIPPDAL